MTETGRRGGGLGSQGTSCVRLVVAVACVLGAWATAASAAPVASAAAPRSASDFC